MLLSILPPPRINCYPHRLASPLLSPVPTLRLPAKFCYLNSFASHHGGAQDEYVVGDCLVFEEGAFNDPYLKSDSGFEHPDSKPRVTSNATKAKKQKKVVSPEEIEPQKLVPDQWNHVLEEVNITKKERRRIAQELEFGSRVEKKRRGSVPIRNVNLQEYLKVKEDSVAQPKPVVLDYPSSLSVKQEKTVGGLKGGEPERQASGARVAPKNPRWAVYGKGFKDLAEFFSSGGYEPVEKKSDGPRKLFSKEEKVLLNKRVPDLATATSGKWLPLHTLAASGEFYLVDKLLKHNVDINSVDKDGLTAIHKAILGKKQAVTNYLLRESANPFVRDKDGATLIHYAVRTASTPAIKVLLLYNVDINLQDDDGWTPLHLAVQARRTDVAKLLLIKGADKTLKNKDGLTPLDLCLYSGQDIRTYELIKLLKQLPRNKNSCSHDQDPE